MCLIIIFHNLHAYTCSNNKVDILFLDHISLTYSIFKLWIHKSAKGSIRQPEMINQLPIKILMGMEQPLEIMTRQIISV